MVKMNIQKLPIEIQSLLDASAKITSYKTAIEELVYNSLDADATSVAIRIHIHERFIQVIDNGSGIAKRNIPILGQRYTSSKIPDTSIFKSAPNKYGFRGQSLCNIIEVSQSVIITTRCDKTEKTWVKSFQKGLYKDSHMTSMRPSKGTTVEVKGFRYNLHIQEKATNILNELQNIKSFLQQVSLVNTNVSISFRDNSKNDIIFKIHKNRDVYQTLSSLFEIDKNDFQELHIEKNQYKVKGFIGKQDARSNSYRWIYLNGRFVYKSTLHNIINVNIMKNQTICGNVKMKKHLPHIEKKFHSNANEIPPYFIFISCPYSDYDINNTAFKTIIEFKDWNHIKQLMDKLVKFYKGDIKLKEIEIKPTKQPEKEIRNTQQEVRRIIEKVLGNKAKNQMISQMHKGVKGKIIRKKFKKKLNRVKTETNNSHSRGKDTTELEQELLVPQKNSLLSRKNLNKKLIRDNTQINDSHKRGKKNTEFEQNSIASKKDSPVLKKRRKKMTSYNIQLKKPWVKSKENTESEELIIPKKNSTPVFNNLQIYNKSTKSHFENKNLQGIKKKTIKYLKVRQKSKSKECINSLKNIFITEGNMVKNRCKLYSDNLKDTFNNKINEAHKNIPRRYSNVKYDNTIMMKKQKQDIVYNEQEEYLCSVQFSNNAIIPLNKVNKKYLKSSDLLKTILSSQKEYSCYIGNDTFHLKNIQNQCPYIDSMINTSDKTIAYVDNVEPNLPIIHNVTFPNVTFESHDYEKNNIVSIKRNIMQSIKVTSNSNTRISKEHKSYSHVQSIGNKKVNICKIPCTKLDKNMQHSEHKSSHIIEYSNCISNVENLTIGNEIDHHLYQNTTLDQWNYKVTDNIQSTYTVIDSNVSFDVASYINNLNKRNRNQETISSSSQGNLKSPNNLIEKANCQKTLPQRLDDSKENDLKIIFISNSEHSASQNPICEPLNLCEAVYHSQNDHNLNNNFDLCKDKTFIENDTNSISNELMYAMNNKEWTANFDDNLFPINNEIEELSHHFHNVDKNCNLHSDIVNDNLISDKQYNCIDKDEQNLNNQNEIQIKGSLEICFETVPNYIVTENQSVSKNFILQDRHSFVPKGMSPIFKKCQTKNVCSYNLEMDYFKDDVYNNFANDVLDNIKTFENRIINMGDNVSENITHNKDHSCLKFNAHCLQNAKVFGQVDKKFIVAEIHSETYNMKHLILFDQHAVDERIKLENNLSDYREGDQWKSVNCEKLTIKLAKDNVIYLNNFKDKFMQLGLKYSIHDCDVSINAIPKAIFGKHCRQTDVILRSIKNLILEEIKAIKTLGGNTLLYPKSIMDLVFSEACRYAIKFGDKLSKRECVMLINILSSCKTPFQCAHGRPVLAVLLDMTTFCNEYKVDMCNISKFKNKQFK